MKPANNTHAAVRGERTLRKLLQANMVGTVTHASLIDRRARHTPSSGFDPKDYVQLRAAGAAQMNLLRRILDRDALSIMARAITTSDDRRHGTLTEAVLEIAGGARALVHGSLASARAEYSIRIDGDRGVLLVTRTLISFRKRGWPVFVPIRFPGIADAVGATESTGDDRAWSDAFTEAAIRSDQTRRIVALPARPGGPAGASPAGSPPEPRR